MRSRKSKEQSASRDARVTRAAILDAAREGFAEKNYDRVGLREIAKRAGVDKRLITRYFGTKENLFAMALDASVAKFEIADRQYSNFGKESVGHIFGPSALPESERVEFTSLCLHAASSLVGENLIRENLQGQIDQIAKRIGGKKSRVRASLLLSLLMGISLLREVLETEPLCELSYADAKTFVAPALQQFVDGVSVAKKDKSRPAKRSQRR